MKLSCMDVEENGILYREKPLLKFKHVIGITHRENEPVETNWFDLTGNANSSRFGNFDDSVIHYLDVHYFKVDRKNRHKWKKKTLSFESKQLSLVQLYKRTLRKGLRDFLEKSFGPKRPKKLLVFVNPVGGKGTAKRKYDRRVAPIFECAGIKTHVVTTTHQNHAREHLLDNDVATKGYCGVVGVGGEGMVSEIVNGLLGRQKLDVGMETLKKGFSYEKVGVRVGIIPCGSTNALAYTLQGKLNCFVGERFKA